MSSGRPRARRSGAAGSASHPILIAGAGGFVGANLVHELVARGAAVHVVVRPASDPARLEAVAPRITVHRADVTDLEAMRACLRAARPRAVVNAVRSRVTVASPVASVRDGVLGAVTLLTAAAEGGSSTFVHLGSSLEYGSQPGPLHEAMALRPTTPDGASKAAATLACRALARDLGVRLTVLRLFQVYGPWDEPNHLVPKAIDAALTGRELVLAPAGRRDWVFVEDVVAACVRALDADLDGAEVNIGSGRQTTNADVVAAVEEVSGKPIRRRIDQRAGRPWDRDDWVADVSKAAALLGWAPRHDLRTGLAKTIAWERERRTSAAAAGRAHAYATGAAD